MINQGHLDYRYVTSEWKSYNGNSIKAKYKIRVNLMQAEKGD